MLKSKLSILHINSYFLTSPLHRRLVERLAEDEAVHQEVYCPTDGIGDHIEEPKSPQTHLSVRPCFGRIHRKLWPLKMIMIWRDFVKWQKRRHFDVVHAHTLVVNGIIAYLYYKRTGTPYLITVRNTDANKFLKRTPLIKWLVKPVLTNARKVIFLGPAFWTNNFREVYSPSFLARLEKKVAFVPNGIDDFWIRNLVSEEKQINGSFNILFVGALKANKNVDTLLHACRRLQSLGILVSIQIVGSGGEEANLRKLAEGMDVTFHGMISEKTQLARLYRHSHVLAVISKTESFGLVYGEALAQGTPILYSKKQGFDGVFGQGVVGYAVDPNDIGDIAEKLINIKSNFQEIQRAVLKVRDRFSWERVSLEILKLYQAAIVK